MKILIVEDEKRIAANIASYFTANNLLCDLVYTGQEALESSEITTYDLVILDWMLPDLSGIEVCKKLRTKDNKTPILMLTARGELDDKIQGFDAGVDDYLVKPFLMEELLARTKTLIRRTMTNTANPVIKVADLVIDTNTSTVKREGVVIELAPKEFALLEYMALNACKTLNRSDVLEHVWGDQVDPFSNTVDVHIRYLRLKIDDGHKKKLIKTVKNKGYMLCGE